MRALAVVRDSGLPDAWIGAGVLRDLVWGCRYGDGFDLRDVRDVDVAFFDPADLSQDNDQRATARLAALEPGLPWEAKNQAAVHTWYPQRFGGGPVPPLHGIADAVATWPEYGADRRVYRGRSNRCQRAPAGAFTAGGDGRPWLARSRSGQRHRAPCRDRRKISGPARACPGRRGPLPASPRPRRQAIQASAAALPMSGSGWAGSARCRVAPQSPDRPAPRRLSEARTPRSATRT
ncbi:hypothetical protein E1193_00600 [Micromonospora sp. KC606]|nr:hypothetical protein E1193_00600 [Micromonospora sp. KC606]